MLHIGTHLSDKKVLCLTYNSRLRVDTTLKAAQLSLPLQSHTFHSFCASHYDVGCKDDSQLYSIVRSDLKPYQAFEYDLVILDESQDMCFLYYTLLCKLVADNGFVPQFCVLGDGPIE